MFKVGMGVLPTIPDTLCDEGQQFVDRCLQHKPYSRATISELQEHHFIKVFMINKFVYLLYVRNLPMLLY